MTKLLAVTCATGGPDHAVMTDVMIDSLLSCDGTNELKVAVLAQALDGKVQGGDGVTVIKSTVNCGFGLGMNKAIEWGLKSYPDTEKVLVLNNDLRFPEPKWIARLLRAPY